MSSCNHIPIRYKQQPYFVNQNTVNKEMSLSGLHLTHGLYQHDLSNFIRLLSE